MRSSPDGDEQAQVVSLLRAVFTALDRNCDRVLQLAELDRAVAEGNLDESQSAVAAMLKVSFERIRALSREGWLEKRNGITLADLLVLEELLAAAPSDLSGEKREIRGVADGVVARVAAVAGVRPSLYGKGPSASIKPIAVRQGVAGNSLLLACIASVAAANPDSIARMIRECGDGSYTVVFPGARQEPVVVSPPGLVELALYAELTRYGTWPCVLEKAYGQFLHREERSDRLVVQESPEIVEHVHESLDLLTGHCGQWRYISDFSDEELTRLIRDAFRDGRASIATSIASPDGCTADAGIPSGHAFSMIKWDESRSRLTLRNPWGPRKRCAKRPSEPENEQGRPLDGIRDGIFAMGLLRFRRNFSTIYIEEFSPHSSPRRSSRCSLLDRVFRRRG